MGTLVFLPFFFAGLLLLLFGGPRQIFIYFVLGYWIAWLVIDVAAGLAGTPSFKQLYVWHPWISAFIFALIPVFTNRDQR